jgi:hypothetical protein
MDRLIARAWPIQALIQRDVPEAKAWALIAEKRRVSRQAGPHVVASVRDYTELLNSKFLENLHVATS